jgi:hypothetical protein
VTTPSERVQPVTQKRNRVAQGTPGAGRFATEEARESDISLELQQEIVEAHELAHLGISTVHRSDGVTVARNNIGPGITCPFCHGEESRQEICSSCFGRGRILDVPFCPRPWDEVFSTPTGGVIHLGGHDCQPSGGSCKVTDQFDVVVSLYSRTGWGPDRGVEHHTHTMIDGDLDPSDHERIHELADRVVEAAEAGKRVLVRCQAGMNRSGLVTALALVKMGWEPDDAMDHMRSQRSPYVLFNESFVDFVRSTETNRTA